MSMYDKKQEIKTPMQVVKREYLCPKCDKGKMEFTGESYMSNPPLYGHKCNICGYWMEFYTQFPLIDFEENKGERS